MIALLAMASVLLAGAVAAVGVSIHRDLVAIADQLSGSGQVPDLEGSLEQLWRDVHQLHAEQADASDKRLRDVEAVLAQVRQNQAGVTSYVNWMVPLVKHWARSTPE